jgi:hypothetical protein
LKDNFNNVFQSSIQSMNVTEPTIFGDEMMTTQVTKTDAQSLDEVNKQALENNLSIINITQCISQLKEYYNISMDKDLILSKTDSLQPDSNSTEGTNKAVSFEFYNPDTMEKLNKSVCNSFEVKTPIADRNFNQTLYNQLKEQGVDMLNPKDPAFQSKCFSNIDSSTNYSTTLNYRIDNYFQNATAQCSNGCKYKNVDQNGYITCDCSGVVNTDNEFINKLGDYVLNGVSNLNIEVLLCYQQVFNVYII